MCASGVSLSDVLRSPVLSDRPFLWRQTGVMKVPPTVVTKELSCGSHAGPSCRGNVSLPCQNHEVLSCRNHEAVPRCVTGRRNAGRRLAPGRESYLPAATGRLPGGAAAAGAGGHQTAGQGERYTYCRCHSVIKALVHQQYTDTNLVFGISGRKSWHLVGIIQWNF